MQDKSAELLAPVRKEIDIIDHELLSLFLRRMKCSEKVAEIKEAAGIPVLSAGREQEILDRVNREAGEYGGAAMALYSSIMAISRARQHKLLDGGRAIRELTETAPKKLDIKNKRILCQGVSGAYSHKAARMFFGEDSNISFAPAFESVFEALEHDKTDFGVLPVENSAAGSVSEVYGLIMKYRYFICGAVDVSVVHCLAKRAGEEIKGVISHPQALLQCSEYIRSNGLSEEKFSNTAAAAKCIAEGGKPGFGAICSREAAEKYGLTIVEDGIQDNKNNRTRFAVISKEAVLPSDAGKISLCFSIPNITGSLYSVLERFALSGLNLSKIESRPIMGSDFEYDFYLDFQGNIHNGDVLSLICSLHDELPRFSFLGNYNEI